MYRYTERELCGAVSVLPRPLPGIRTHRPSNETFQIHGTPNYDVDVTAFYRFVTMVY
jgi:hypothetical protein